MTDFRAEMLATGDAGAIDVEKAVGSDGVFIAAFEDEFVALVHSDRTGTYHSYFSADGRTWAASDTPMGVFEDRAESSPLYGKDT